MVATRRSASALERVPFWAHVENPFVSPVRATSREVVHMPVKATCRVQDKRRSEGALRRLANLQKRHVKRLAGGAVINLEKKRIKDEAAGGRLCREAAALVAGNDAVKHRYPRTLAVQGRANRVIGHSTRSATTGGKTARRCCITT